jgi:hypothetical protein
MCKGRDRGSVLISRPFDVCISHIRVRFRVRRDDVELTYRVSPCDQRSERDFNMTASEPVGGNETHTGELITTILTWTPEILKDCDYYEGLVLNLPHLPFLVNDMERYKQAYRPAVLVELHQGLHAALERPDKSTRHIKSTLIEEVSTRSKIECRTSRSIMLRLRMQEDSLARSMDFVFISPSPKPWSETSVVCATGVVASVKKPKVAHGGSFVPPAWYDVHVEVPINYASYIEMLGDAGKLYITVIASIASGFRIFEALCDGDHSELLSHHILNPGPSLDAERATLNPLHADLIEHVAS